MQATTSEVASRPAPGSKNTHASVNMAESEGLGVDVIPEVPECAKPFVGQEFDDQSRAREFYNAYARLGGFSIRMNQVHTLASTGEQTWRRIVCSREGKHVKSIEKDESPASAIKTRRKRASARCGCKARLEISRSGSSGWLVSRFVEGHSHELVDPGQSFLLRSHRAIDEESMEVIKACKDAGIGPSATFNLASELGGRKEVRFTRQDVKNAVGHSRRLYLKRDAELALEYLQRKQDKYRTTYFSVKKDEKGSLTCMFWADGRSRLDFQAFRDVLCFDTTYRTNKYMMPFAPFVGLNHHRQTVVFGCGLVSDESTESFVCLFQHFKDAMGGISPTSIITDQDAAIEAAIEAVFPTSVHRYCLWHILKKVPEKLSRSLSEYEDLHRALLKCVYNDVSPDDFDANWSRLIDRYNLRDNAWLVMLHARRSKWAPIFHRRHRFFGMCSNQRSEGFHAFMDRFINRKTSLLEFVKQIDKALCRRRVDELEKDKQTREAILERRTSYVMEAQFFDAYTAVNFRDIQEQMWMSNAYTVDLVGEDDEESFYDVVKPDDRYDSRAVEFNRLSMSGKCSCQLFESTGIVCRHIFAVFWMLKIIQVPQYFIVRRLSRQPRHGYEVDAPVSGNEKAAGMEGLGCIMQSITAIAAGNHNLLYHATEACNRSLREIQDLQEIYEVAGELAGEMSAEEVSGDRTGNVQLNVDDATQNPATAEGRGRPKRRKKAHPKQKARRKC